MEKIQVFPGIYTGDLVISLSNMGSGIRMKGDIFKVLPKSSAGILFYKVSTTSNTREAWRLATQEEIAWHMQNPDLNSNIENMPKGVENYQVY